MKPLSGRREAAQLRQLAFGLPRDEALGRADFLVSDCNAAAVARIESWPQWPSPVLLLHGPCGAGKTHLARLWCRRAGADLLAGASLDSARTAGIIGTRHPRLAVDGAADAPERVLLHLFNTCREAGGSLLLTSRIAPGPWRPALADLDSRLRSVLSVGIGLPDDALLGAVLAKHFADRQVRVAAEVIDYLVSHIERSLAAAADIAAALDETALRRGGAITIALASRVVAAHQAQPLPSAKDEEVT